MPKSSKDTNHDSSSPRVITGVILAGGKSSRYGENKAFVEVNGTRLIERVVEVLAPIFTRIVLITNSPQQYAYLNLPMYKDLIAGLGPIGGIYTGLEAISDEAGFFVACDMPFLNPALINHMLKVRGDYDAVVPRMDWKLETLHTIYAKRCLPAIRELIDSRIYQVMRSFHKISVRYIDEDEIKSIDPDLRSFLNINRPEELLGIEDPKER